MEKSPETIDLEEYSAITTRILQKLYVLCLENHSEGRHSAIHIFCSIFSHNCAILSIDYWLEIFNQMLWKLMNFVIANVVNDKPTLKTWEETTVILLQNIQKLIKRFF